MLDNLDLNISKIRNVKYMLLLALRTQGKYTHKNHIGNRKPQLKKQQRFNVPGKQISHPYPERIKDLSSDICLHFVPTIMYQATY